MTANTKQKKKKKTASKKKSAKSGKNRVVKAGKKSLKKKRSISSLPKRTRIILCVSVVFFAAIVLIVGFAINNSHNGRNLLNTEKDVAMGIDVSHHNGNVDWHTAAESIDFAFVRVGYRGYSKGEINPDKKAKHNLRFAEKAGVPLGVYFYSQAVTVEEAEQEAHYALKKIRGHDVSLPVFIDCEYASDSSGNTGRLYEAELSREEMTDIINAFCSVIKEAGYTPGVYASTYFYKTALDAENVTHNAVIWVADYNDSITYDGDYDIWQSTDSGHCDGVSSEHVDIDYWYLRK